MSHHFFVTLLLLSFSFFAFGQEGTRQVMPPDTIFTGNLPRVPVNGTGLLISKDILQGSFLEAATNNSYVENRIYFNIQNIAEKFYFGFKAYNRPFDPANDIAAIRSDVYYKIYDPTGNLVAGPTNVTTGNPGWINTYAQAYNGPNISGSNPSGYTPLSYQPATTGNYFIVIYPSSDGGATEYSNSASAGNPASAPTVLTFFDFTVANGTSPEPGRVYSQKWSFIAYQPDIASPPANRYVNQGSELVSSVASFYALTNDHVVDKISFQDGFRPLSYILAFNNYGVDESQPDFSISRQSVFTGTNAPTLANGYKVFLNDPDPALVGTFTPPSAPEVGKYVLGCGGNFKIPYTIAEPGDVRLRLDFNGDYSTNPNDPSDKVLYAYNQTAGAHLMDWDGLDGLGAPQTNQSTITITVTFSALRGRTNVPLFDAEQNVNGFVVTPITQPHTVKYYWNDAGLIADGICNNNTNTTSGGIDNSTAGQTVGHPWNGNPSSPGTTGDATPFSSCDDFGNVRTINTWFWGYEVATTNTVTLRFLGCMQALIDDIDDDDDGIPDLYENSANGMDPVDGAIHNPFADADGDGIPAFLDPSGEEVNGNWAWVDVNGDGVNDHWDADLDGIINELDRDSDNDGIPDLVESGGEDLDGDGRIDNPVDSNGDGLFDQYDPATGGIALYNVMADDGNGHTRSVFDWDGDGIPNYLDLDSDNDGIPDVIEQGGTDVNFDGRIDMIPVEYNGDGKLLVDRDGDGFYDGVDSRNDVDNSGILMGTPLIITAGTDPLTAIYFKVEKNNTNDGFNYNTVSTLANADQTGMLNMMDLDADGDGIADVVEAGIPENGTTGQASGTLVNGWSTTAKAYLQANGLRNTDGHGRPNYLDIDADDDGITDNIEGQSTAGYVSPSGVDTDLDGIDDAYDTDINNYGGHGITPYDKDGDGIPDYIDTDSDNDGVIDVVEGNGNGNDAVVVVNTDADEDGLLDQFDGYDLATNANDYYINQFAVDPFHYNVTATTMGSNGAHTGGLFDGTTAALSFADDITGTERDWRFVSVLPISLIEFKGNKQENGNLLQWTTVSETNASHFDIQKSIDGTNYTTIGTVATSGLTNGSSYHFLDAAPKDVNYYRLKMVDMDGHFKLSKTIVLKGDANESIVLNAVRPNPFVSQFTLSITLPEDQMLEILISDNVGRIITKRQIAGRKGLMDIKVDKLESLSSGVYFVKVKTDKGMLQQRILKVTR